MKVKGAQLVAHISKIIDSQIQTSYEQINFQNEKYDNQQNEHRQNIKMFMLKLQNIALKQRRNQIDEISANNNQQIEFWKDIQSTLNNIVNSSGNQDQEELMSLLTGISDKLQGQHTQQISNLNKENNEIKQRLIIANNTIDKLSRKVNNGMNSDLDALWTNQTMIFGVSSVFGVCMILMYFMSNLVNQSNEPDLSMYDDEIVYKYCNSFIASSTTNDGWWSTGSDFAQLLYGVMIIFVGIFVLVYLWKATNFLKNILKALLPDRLYVKWIGFDENKRYRRGSNGRLSSYGKKLVDVQKVRIW